MTKIWICSGKNFTVRCSSSELQQKRSGKLKWWKEPVLIPPCNSSILSMSTWSSKSYLTFSCLYYIYFFVYKNRVWLCDKKPAGVYWCAIIISFWSPNHHVTILDNKVSFSSMANLKSVVIPRISKKAIVQHYFLWRPTLRFPWLKAEQRCWQQNNIIFLVALLYVVSESQSGKNNLEHAECI